MRSATTKVLVRQALGLFVWNVLSGVLPGQCVTVTQVPNQTINSGTSCFSNNDTLNASGVTINGSASVTFVGGRMVHLTPGFRATAGVGAAGTTFHAWVETAPSAISVSPATGTGPSQQFTWVVSSPLGYANIAQVFPLINTSASGGSGCYIYYNRASNFLFLADDLATTWNGGFAPGSSSSVSNSYCTIYGIGSSVNSSGSQLSLTVKVAFQSATFSGAKNNYLNVVDNQGLYSEYQPLGTWTVANQWVTPNITSVSPTSAVAGTQVTIAGSGFGVTRGAGSIWLGTALGTVVSWSDTQIIATVAANATSGSARVRQNETWSNAVTFAVATATISSVVPASGAAGTQVTITGTKFGASQGSGQVWLGTANAIVQSWSDTQVVAVVASGASSGTARVLQGGVMSNGVTFTVTSLNITSVSPVSASPGALVTIAGTGFGGSQGSGTVLLGSVNGQVVSWSDTQVVAAVASNSVTGVARVQQNGAWSKGLSFSVIGGTVTLTPNLINLAVGETQPIQARGSNGQPVTGLTWSSSDTNVVSLSADNPPILTAVAPGRATIIAGSASADVTVFAGVLPLETPIWSNPVNATQIIPAVPSPNGVADVFALGSGGIVHAITSEGLTAWTADVSQALDLSQKWAWMVPDFRGGLVAMLGRTITTLDGRTGQPTSVYSLANESVYSVALHTDGTIFADLRTDTGNIRRVVGVDPSNGTEKFSLPLPNNIEETTEFVVAGDGYAYIAYAVENGSCSAGYLKVLRVSSSGSTTEIPVFDWQGCHQAWAFPFWEVGLGAITDGDTGIILSWKDITAETATSISTRLTRISGGTATTIQGPTLPGMEQQAVSMVLQLEDGSFVGTAMVGDRWAPWEGLVPHMVAFDASGAVRWSVANEEPAFAVSGGGVIGKSGVQYDQNGLAIGRVNLRTQSWRNNVYFAESSTAVAQLMLLGGAAARPHVATSWWPTIYGNMSANAAAVLQAWFPPLDTRQDQAIYNALNDLVSRRLREPDVSRAAELEVFNRIGGVDSNGAALTTQNFIRYLTMKRPGLYDGTRSEYCYRAATSPFLYVPLCYVPGPSYTIQDRFREFPGAGALTASPSFPLLVFFRPSLILTDAAEGRNLGNEATLFHEALHGITGLGDETLLPRLGLGDYLSVPSCRITRYIEIKVLRLSPGLNATNDPDARCDLPSN